MYVIQLAHDSTQSSNTARMRPAAIGIKGWGAEGKREERSKRPATIFYSQRVHKLSERKKVGECQVDARSSPYPPVHESPRPLCFQVVSRECGSTLFLQWEDRVSTVTRTAACGHQIPIAGDPEEEEPCRENARHRLRDRARQSYSVPSRLLEEIYTRRASSMKCK